MYRITERVFIRIDKMHCSLLWGGGQPRIALKILQRSRFEGGIALPNVIIYYTNIEAAQVSIINEWIYTDTNHPAYRMDRRGMGGKSCLHMLYGRGATRETAPGKNSGTNLAQST